MTDILSTVSEMNTLPIPPHFNKRTFLYVKQTESEPDSNYYLFCEVIKDYLPIFTELLKQINWNEYTGEDNPHPYPYQIIGGYAIVLMRKHLGIDFNPFPLTPDIDVEFNTLVRTGSNGISYMQPFLLEGEINPIYVECSKKIYKQMESILENIQVQLADLIPQLEHPEPSEDDEAKYQDPEYNRAIGPFHISLILNKNYISKILVFTKYEGRHYHVFDFQFTSNTNYIKKHPYKFTSPDDVYIASPQVLLEKNIDALINRYTKKIKLEDNIESLLVSYDLQNNKDIKDQQMVKINKDRHLLVELNRKLIHHTLRIIYIMKVMALNNIYSAEIELTIYKILNSLKKTSIFNYPYQNLVPKLFYDILSEPENNYILPALHKYKIIAHFNYLDIQKHVMKYNNFINYISQNNSGGRRKKTRKWRVTK